MGGDNAPKEQVLGAMKAIEAFPDVEIILVGDENKIKPYLTMIEMNFHFTYRRRNFKYR